MSVGAVPVFAEIDETLCIDPTKLESYITEKTKAILPVHMCGAMAKIDKIKEIADKYNILLIEDACQATGAHINGKYAGTWGIAGCFSFDAVKTITCGEGGSVVTNSEDIYKKADAYHDHGHDHIGNDRGKENHEFLGVNYRISELNAAVGVAQLNKLDKILEIQRKNHSMIEDTLNSFEQIKLREIPDKNGDSCSFISFILPSENTTRLAAQELANTGVDGTFYWYDNNWHYIRNWNHIKDLKTVMNIPHSTLPNMSDYSKLNLPQSDDIMSRTISMQIKLSWTEEQLIERCNKISDVFNRIFS
jgi:8-amino-3,8-dideoxy-alpha-D-manno-octulosonate transaminase